MAIGGIYYTDDRAAILQLSDVMYRDGMAIISKTGLGSLGDLRGKSTGVVQGYLWNAELQKALGQDSVKIYQDSTSMISDINSGRLDAGILTSAEAAFRAQGGLKAAPFAADPSVPSSTKPGKVVIPSPKGNSSLGTAINGDIATLLKDGTVAKALQSNGMDPALAGPGTSS
jgi:polar amino acid transport system substrate-binding protein